MTHTEENNPYIWGRNQIIANLLRQEIVDARNDYLELKSRNEKKIADLVALCTHRNSDGTSAVKTIRDGQGPDYYRCQHCHTDVPWPGFA